jgi:hypothetical protein
MIAERALAIFAFFGELRAPLQVVSGNSTIIVFGGALGTDTAVVLEFHLDQSGCHPVVGRLHALDPLGVWPDVWMGLFRSRPIEESCGL